jgi:hypothetical protein
MYGVPVAAVETGNISKTPAPATQHSLLVWPKNNSAPLDLADHGILSSAFHRHSLITTTQRLLTRTTIGNENLQKNCLGLPGTLMFLVLRHLTTQNEVEGY